MERKHGQGIRETAVAVSQLHPHVVDGRRHAAQCPARLAQRRDERTEDQVAWIVDRMNHYGSIAFGRQCARQFAGAALYEFRNAYGHLPESDDKRFILEMVLYMIERKC